MKLEKSEFAGFEFQNWPVYRKSIEFAKKAHRLCSSLPKEGSRSISDQLRRASQSIALNVAEGSSRYSRNDKMSFLRVARGSVFECAATLDLIRELGFATVEATMALHHELTIIGRMLSGFIKHIETNNPGTSKRDRSVGSMRNVGGETRQH